MIYFERERVFYLIILEPFFSTIEHITNNRSDLLETVEIVAWRKNSPRARTIETKGKET